MALKQSFNLRLAQVYTGIALKTAQIGAERAGIHKNCPDLAQKERILTQKQ